MIAFDTNILVYAHREDAAWHKPAIACLTSVAQSLEPWAIPWPCIHEFIAISTHPRIYDPPTPLKHSIEQVECWLESPALIILGETEDHWQTLRSILAAAKVNGPQVHDARIAALCLQHGIRELWTADRDLSRFSQVRVLNPLIDK